jgi:intracellular sulfur oxidation DsrE/DsrF family protein
MNNERRNFVATLAAGITGLSIAGAAPLSAEQAADEPWLAFISSKKQRAFLDITRFFSDGAPYGRAGNLLTALRESYGVPERDIGIALGVHGSGLGHVLSQSAWDGFHLADIIAPQLPSDEGAAVRAGAAKLGTTGAESCKALLGRGCRVLACNNSLTRWAKRFADERGQTTDAMLKRLVDALHPGVERAPAMVAAAVLAQQKGVGYVAIV